MKRKTKMRYLLMPFRLLYVIYALALFVALMIPVFLWSLLVLPLGRIRSGNLTYYGCVAWSRIWCTLCFIWHRNIYEEKYASEGSGIYVSNHISYLDSALIPSIFVRPVRPLGKVEMTRIPIFGFIYRNAIVTVDRSSPANRAKSVAVLKSLLLKGISVLVFPEGTFNTTHRPLKEFYEGAFRIAIETGSPVRPVLILDAYERMHYRSIFTLNPGRSRAVFLREIPVAGLQPEDATRLKEEVFQAMEEALLRYRAAWIDNRAGAAGSA